MQDDNNLQLTIKRKWQIALRRYVVEGNPAVAYASYFGLPAFEFKRWIEGQLTGGMNWENFGSRWNLSQRVPTSLFDLSNENQLRLCWHFTNIIAQDMEADAAESSKILLSARKFYEELQKVSNLELFDLILNHLKQFESSKTEVSETAIRFVQENNDLLQTLQAFESEDYARLNKGEKLSEILSEKEILKKYGS